MINTTSPPIPPTNTAHQQQHRYSPQGGSVAITIEEKQGKVEVCVADSGLGLSFVQRIVELHRAEIRLQESEMGGEVCVLFGVENSGVGPISEA